MLPRNKIFVGSLPPSTKPEEVRRLFENYGVVTECDVMNRCAFVHMQTPDMMDNAIQALHNSDFKGVTINVERGRTKERAPGGGGDGGESGGRGGFRGGRGGYNQQNRPNYGDDGDRSGGPMRNNRGNMRNQPYGSGGGGGGGGAGRGGSYDGQSNQGGGGGGGFRGGRGGGGGGRGDYNDRGSGGRGGGGQYNSGGGSGGSRFSGGQQSEDRRGFALPNESADRFSGARSGGLAMSSFKDPFVRRSIGDAPAGPSAPYVNRGIYSQGTAAATTQATANYNQAFPPLGGDESRNVTRGPPPPQQQQQQQQRWMQ